VVRGVLRIQAVRPALIEVDLTAVNTSLANLLGRQVSLVRVMQIISKLCPHVFEFNVSRLLISKSGKTVRTGVRSVEWCCFMRTGI